MEKSVFVGFDEESVKNYMEKFYEKDCLRYLYSLHLETTVYKDSRMLDDSIREETEFFQRFLKPSGIPFGAGILVIKNQNAVGVFNLFRNASMGDFSEKDVYILNVLKKHLENMLCNAIQISRAQNLGDETFSRAVEHFELSEREADVLRLIADGKSNGDISEQIHVSISTVKKHVYNIFNKAGVNSRTQLLNMIYTN